MNLSRRRFLVWVSSALTAAGPASGVTRMLSPAADVPEMLQSDRPSPRQPFASLPKFSRTQIAGVGTYQVENVLLPTRALAGGVRLAATSPDYRGGRAERLLAEALTAAARPTYVMTQIPVAAWSAGNRRQAFHRALRRSLGRLKRERVEALLVRNAEPEQLQDPEFRAFAQEAVSRRLVGAVGASGHGPDTEKVLAAAVDDPLIEVVLFGAHLHDYGKMAEWLPRARAAGKRLVAMKCREAALIARLPGWERERSRRRHAPWNGRWDPEFSRRAVAWAVEVTGADNALVGARYPGDVGAMLGET